MKRAREKGSPRLSGREAVSVGVLGGWRRVLGRGGQGAWEGIHLLGSIS